MNDLESIDRWLRLLDQRPLTDTERTDFQNLLKRSPEAMDRYLDHCEMNTWLAAGSGGEAIEFDESQKPTSPEPVPGERRQKSALITIGTIAAVIALSLIARSILTQPDSAPEISDAPVEISPDSSTGPEDSTVNLAVVDQPRDKDPWKVINATGSVKHPGLKDKPTPVVSSDRPVKFNRDIRPILSETCFHCHGPDEHGRRADLRLDSLEGATADLGGTIAIVPGDLTKSEAWWRIISDDEDELMPPPESHLVLTEPQKQLIKRWIEEGAEYEGHWAFEAPVRPQLLSADANGNEIDSFIRARAADEGLSMSAEASPRTLIRRLSFDLTGLPPTHEEVSSFLTAYEDDSDAAWQSAIDRLLSSPHFGERMALPWLDQARYADTNGYSIDGGRHMWLWRDWVIQAYNENKPFDAFTIEQIAGDLLPDATPAQITATGFNRNHMITHEGGTIPAENLTNYAADRVKTTSEVFLGLTMACAQCHDHKYDPISIKEYYEFFSFFNELSDRGNDGNRGVNAVPNIMAKTVLPGTELPSLRSELAATVKKLQESKERFEEWLTEVQHEESQLGSGFELVELETLDLTAPNRPGIFEILDDGSSFLSEPTARGGMNAFSHSFKLPPGKSINGIRIRFFPHPEKRLLSAYEANAPIISTVVASAGDQEAKQVEHYNQLQFSNSTASSQFEDMKANHVLDERNIHLWRPSEEDKNPHLTLTFAQPVDSEETPFLTVLVFFGQNGATPYHWRIDGFQGVDTDSRFSREEQSILQRNRKSWSQLETEVVESLFRDEASSLAPLRIRIANLKERISVLTEAHSTMVMDTAPKPRETFVLDRGQYDAPLEKVTPSTPSALPSLRSNGKATRLDLANWMTSTENPLTARVAANRIWQIFFGTGLVATTADFGSQGEWPSHPELLDWLAVEFMESGWDQKALIRKIVSSAAYRQDSSANPDQREKDPNNRLLARGPRFRLAAEFVRDQTLAKSGLLVPRIGGPSVQPYQPAGLWKEVSHFGSTPATKQVFVQDRGEKLYRRSLYTVVKRTSPHPAMAAFDAPNREMCITERGVTNTPLQALVTLNDPQFAEAARVFAARLLRESSALDDRERISLAFEKITGRAPDASEANALASFLSDERNRFQNNEAGAESLIRVGESPADVALPAVEQAVWTQISSLLFNLSETLTRL